MQREKGYLLVGSDHDSTNKQGPRHRRRCVLYTGLVGWGGQTALLMGTDVGRLCRFGIRKLKEHLTDAFTVLSKIGNDLIS